MLARSTVWIFMSNPIKARKPQALVSISTDMKSKSISVKVG